MIKWIDSVDLLDWFAGRKYAHKYPRVAGVIGLNLKMVFKDQQVQTNLCSLTNSMSLTIFCACSVLDIPKASLFL